MPTICPVTVAIIRPRSSEDGMNIMPHDIY